MKGMKKLISLELKKRRKIIVAGLGVPVFLALIYLFNSFHRNSLMLDEALDLKQSNLAQYRQKVLEKKVVERELLHLKNTFKQAEAALLTGKTPSLAAAEIQEIVSKMTDAAGAQIMTMRILQPDRSAKDIYLAIPVEVTINSTIRQLTQLLYKLDRSAKLLRITKLGIGSPRGRGRLARRPGPLKIVTTLTVEGFVKKMETEL
jgi:hypothetical protein